MTRDVDALRARSRLLAATVLVLTALVGCNDIPRASRERNDLSTMREVSITITGRTTYTAYVADEERTREFGLMNVTEADLPLDHGMIFAFESDQILSFWMRNTIIPLDIAFIRSDGTIVGTHTMQPLDESGYASFEPAKFALEVRAGQFQHWGIVVGDHVVIPRELQDSALDG